MSVEESPSTSQGSSVASGENEASRKRPIVQPNCFTVDKDWENWASKFERCTRVNKWSNGEKCDFLSVYLDGEADKVYCDLPEDVKQDWESLKEALTSRFDPSPQPELFETELSARIRHPGEKLTDLGNVIRTLARKAFPHERAETRDRIAKTKFLRALDGDMQLKVRLAEPKTLEDAVKMAVKYEATVKDVEQNQVERVKATFHARQTSSDGPKTEGMIAAAQGQPKNEEVAGLTELLKRNTEVMGRMVDLLHDVNVNHGESSQQQNRNRGSRMTCWNCGKVGYIRVNCSSKPLDGSAGNGEQVTPGSGLTRGSE